MSNLRAKTHPTTTLFQGKIQQQHYFNERCNNNTISSKDPTITLFQRKIQQQHYFQERED